MRILPIIAQLKAQVALLDGRVEVARSLVALPDAEVLADLPIAFVHASDENAGENKLISAVSQEIPKRFVVMLAAKPVDDVAGIEAMEDLRAQIMTALLGFQPDSDHAPFTYEGGKSFEVNGQVEWWADAFSTWQIIEAV